MNTARPKKFGFSLVEVTMALGIAAFCLITLLALLPIGLSSNQTAVEQTSAAGVASQIIAELRSTPATSTQTNVLQLPIPTAASTKPEVRYFAASGGLSGKDGKTFIASGADESRYRACVGFTPGSALSVRIVVAWPAVADRTNTDWPKNYQGIYEVVTALDRN